MDAVYRPPFFVPPPVLWVPAKNHVFGAATMSGTGDLVAVGKQSSHGAATMAGTGDLSATGKLPISGITDAFTDNSVGSMWSETETGGATVTEQSQRLECAVPGSAVAEASLRSNSLYDLTADACFVRLVSPGANNNANLGAGMALCASGSAANAVWISVANNLIVYGYTVASVDNVTTATYNATNHAWIRLINSGSNILWQTSADASTWTTRRTVATPITITDLQVRLIHQATTTGPGASTAIFDSLNTTAVEVTGAATMSGTGDLTAAGTTKRYGAATMSGTGDLTATGQRRVVGAATMSGSGALTAVGKQTAYGAATMAGAGDLTATGHVQNLVLMSGAGDLSADGFVPTYERPNGTVTTNGWTAVGAGTLWEAIDEVIPADSDYIVSASSPVSPDICEVSLTNVADPGVDTGHIVRYRFQKDTVGGNTINLTVRLVQGTTVIASWTESNIGATVVEAIHELTTGEASAISDYTDLRLRFEAVKV